MTEQLIINISRDQRTNIELIKKAFETEDDEVVIGVAMGFLNKLLLLKSKERIRILKLLGIKNDLQKTT